MINMIKTFAEESVAHERSTKCHLSDSSDVFLRPFSIIASLFAMNSLLIFKK